MALKDSAFSSDMTVFKTQKLRIDAWNVLANSYRWLACSDFHQDLNSSNMHQLHNTASISYGGNFTQRGNSLLLSGNVIPQPILLDPFCQYVGALSKIIEATSSQVG